MNTKYSDFLKMKKITDVPTGISHDVEINPMLMDFQSDIVRWALKRGRACIFADCGLGKTPMQLEWAHHVAEHTGGRVLILAPLAVSHQTIREGEKFGIDVEKWNPLSDAPIQIINYEQLDKLVLSNFRGIVIDESSILKNYTGKYRNQIINGSQCVPFRLACTATPAPNDFMELGNHAEFVGAMTRTEMLASFFVHDGGETQKWRIKGHAQKEFWRWVCSWAVMMRKPSDLGYEDGGFILPALNIHHHTVDVDIVKRTIGDKSGDQGSLFRMPATSLKDRHGERNATIKERCQLAADIINASDEPWIVWCNLNNESTLLKKNINEAVEVKGSDSDSHKIQSMIGFANGDVQKLVTKAKIGGFGMNWQHCKNVAFVGLNDSYEQYYQAIRRCWRFGQKNEVDCHIITASTEGNVVKNIQRKERDADTMAKEMVENMHVYNNQNIKSIERSNDEYQTRVVKNDDYTAYLCDCVEGVKNLPDKSIGYSVFSPPFASLYTYSNSDRDMGNCKTDDEFKDHFRYLVDELFRVIQTGRLVSFHCMNMPTSKVNDGHIGLKDFRGALIRMFEDAGFYYHSEVVIWKDPVTAMQRTKALGLLHKQIVKDSCMSRQGIPDYLVTMRKPGDNQNRVSGEFEYYIGEDEPDKSGRYSINVWQNYASPVWMDINPSNTLSYRRARDKKDERHICPLQLDVIERAVQMWSNEGDTIMSPFMGIGSEGYVAIKRNRKFIGFELKESYFKQAIENLTVAISERESKFLF